MLPVFMAITVLPSNLARMRLDSYRPRTYWAVLLSNLVAHIARVRVVGERSRLCRAGVF